MPKNAPLSAFKTCAFKTITFKFRAAKYCLAVLLGLGMSLSTGSAGDFDTTLRDAQTRISALMSQPLEIPVPKDPGGGYTHEKHKENAKLIYDAGQLYKLTGDKAYARFAEKLILAYADVYPDWGIHPARKEQGPGRMFWQSLNESWWLVHVAQGFDAVQGLLSAKNRAHIETNLLRHMSEFLSQGSPETFNRVHNHGTWATAAVGMTGYALGDQDYVEKALYGLDKKGEVGGFLKQLDTLFSPDGYYNEGPYYQRYALMPFVLFGQAIQQNEPQRGIFAYRDGILEKAIYTTLHLNYGGLFLPINDAIKDKGIATTELLYGVSIAYQLTGDTGLLSIAEAQDKYVLTPESRVVSRDVKAGKATPFDYRSLRLTDGNDGTSGALDILRASNDPQGLAVIAKNTTQIYNTHHHFDQLGLLVYDSGHAILRDYGAARFLNLEAKYGGHYLRENNSYAKQSVAHNVLVVDRTSQFDADHKKAKNQATQTAAFTAQDDLSATSASLATAYDGVTLKRSLAIIKDAAFEQPVIVDLVAAEAQGRHDYDLPFHYNGHLVETNFEVQANTARLNRLGRDEGYQHLWKIAEAEPVDGFSQVTWIKEHRFYSVSTAMPETGKVIFVETGATDPDFNLRHEPGFILRAKTRGGVAFASIIERHGEYNPTVEYTKGSHTQVKQVRHIKGEGVDFIRIETKAGQIVGLAIAPDAAADSRNQIEIDGETVSWQGPYHLVHSKIQAEQGEQ